MARKPKALPPVRQAFESPVPKQTHQEWIASLRIGADAHVVA